VTGPDEGVRAYVDRASAIAFNLDQP